MHSSQAKLISIATALVICKIVNQLTRTDIRILVGQAISLAL